MKMLFQSEWSMDWVDPLVGLGLVELGWEWVANFLFLVGWVLGLGHGSEMADL